MKKICLLYLFMLLPCTIWAAKIPYAIFENGTMTFKYGEFVPDDVNSWDLSNTPVPQGPFPWDIRWNGDVKKAVFDASFADARPKSCAGWFDACTGLESIEGLEYLNTSEVTTMAWMFEACPKLTSLDLSHFDTSNVTDMGNMFAGINNISTLDLSSFNTSKVTNMTYMFAGDNNSNSKLTTIFVGDGWSTASVKYDDLMFDKSPNLKGENGTVYSSDHVTSTYARLDAPGTPGYFSSKISFADATVKQICVDNWDTNGDGELSKSEAAAVTLLNDVFSGKKITSFDELRYFTGLTIFTYDDFHECTELKSITIPAGITSMIGWSFANCAALEKISVDPANTVYDSRNDCNGIIETATNKLILGCQNTIIPNDVIEIGRDAFWGRWWMEKMTIPSSVETIDGCAFAHCISLKNIEIPSSVKAIKDAAFGFSGLTNIVIPATVETFEDNVFRECGELTNVTFNGTAIPDSCFDKCHKLTSVTLNNVKRIGVSAFRECPLSDGIDLTGVEFVGVTAFISSAIKELTIPASLKEVGIEAFTWNFEMKKATFEEGCERVFETMFHGNENLSTVVLASTIKEIQARAFQYCKSLTTINLPEGLETIGDQAFRLSGLTSVLLPMSMKWVGNEAFQTCENLEIADIAYIEHLGYNAFSECKKLRKICVPATIVIDEVSWAAFSWCTNLEEVEFFEGTTRIDNLAFVGCENLKRLPYGLPSTLESIGGDAFGGCKSLESIELPKGVNQIQEYAFKDCTSLVNVISRIQEPMELEKGAFENINSAAILSVPKGTKNAYVEKGWSQYFANIVELAANKLFVSEKQECVIGKTMTLKVELQNEDVVKLSQFDLRLPTGMTVATKSNSKLDANLTNRAANHSISSSQLDNGDYRFIVSSLGDDVFTGNSGVLVNITLNVPANMEAGEHIVKILNTELSVPNGEQLKVVKTEDTETILTVKDYMQGDVNNDGWISVTDVGCTINYILEKTPAVFNFNAADMNSDKNISVTDVGMIIDLILNDGAAGSRGASQIDDRIVVPNISLQQTAEGYDMLLEDKSAFIGFQFDVEPENGATISDVKLDNPTDNDHLMTYCQLDNGKWRVICYSPTNSTFSANENALLSIAAASNITVSDIRLTTRGFNELTPDGIEGATTGITNIEQGIQISVQGKTICITSDRDATLRLLNIGGSVYRILNIHQGVNSFDGLRSGIYMIENKKIIIR